MTALFSVDAFGGGFLVQQSWRFGCCRRSTCLSQRRQRSSSGPPVLGRLPTRCRSARRRIGLVNTMVFTHLPSSLCLIAIPFVQNLYLVIGLLMVRSLLSQMDVPTRTSYVMAVVTPSERPAAAS